MEERRGGYTVASFASQRHIYIDFLHLGHRKHTIYGLVEVDVTRARDLIRDHRSRTGEALSFTAFVLACVGRAVDRSKHMHAYRDWRGRLILFDDVDVATMLEIDVDGQKTPLAHVIRAVNQRTVRDIHGEIRGLQAERRRDPTLPYHRLLPLYRLTPAFVRRCLYRLLLKSPHAMKKSFGTVQLTAVGMFGRGGGWAITEPIYTLGIALGGIAERPGVVDGRIEIREYLSMTVAFDHDIVDGAPATRFIQRLKELMESAYGLEDLVSSPDPAGG